MLIVFLKGILLGVAITAPVGPINLLCIRRSLNHGMKSGLLTGLGAAIADTFFGAVAAFSLTRVSDFLIAHKTTLEFVGAGVFTFMGTMLLRSKPPTESDPEPKGLPSVHAFSSGFLLTLHNPTTVFAFLIAFAAIHLGDQLTILGSSLATLGVFVGATAWWITLSGISSRLRSKFNRTHIHRLNLGTGVLLLCCAGGLLYSAIVD